MKSMLIIGMGDFGHHLCRHLVEMKNEVMIMDKNEEALEDLLEITSGHLIADCTSKSVLSKIGVRDFDMCFVCIGSDFKSNLIIVTLLKELGAQYIVSQTDDEMLERLLLNNGANEVIHPNKDSAIRAAVKYSDEHVFDYLQLKAGYSIYEITPIREWIGKNILESKIRSKYDTYVIGIIDNKDKTTIMPAPDTVIHKTDRLMVLAHANTMEALLKKM